MAAHQLLSFRCAACGSSAEVLLVQSAPVRCPNCDAVQGLSSRPVHGWVYVLSNPSMPGLIKIGSTERDVFDRASELSASSGVPAPFEVEAFYDSDDPRSDEATVHVILQDRRASGQREFFKILPDDALVVIGEALRRTPVFSRPVTTSAATRVTDRPTPDRPREAPEARSAIPSSPREADVLPRTVAGLRRWLDGPDPFLRARAAQALGSRAGPSLIPVLERAADRGPSDLRFHFENAVVRIRERYSRRKSPSDPRDDAGTGASRMEPTE